MYAIIVEPTDDAAEPAAKKNREENGMFIMYMHICTFVINTIICKYVQYAL